MKFVFAVGILIASTVIPVFPQSAKVKNDLPASSAAVSQFNDRTAESFYREANEYSKVKFAEFNEKKLQFSEALRLRTLTEQKQLAAKYAAILKARPNLATEDLFYFGMLHWIAENADGADEVLRKYLDAGSTDAANLQTARGIVVVGAAKKKNFTDAERLLADYLKGNPVKVRERIEMANELAKAYLSVRDFETAARHAADGYALVKSIFSEQTSRARGLAEILDRGRTLYEIHSSAGSVEKADQALDDLRKAAVVTESTGIYFFAVDTLIRYQISTERKKSALEIYGGLKAKIENDFPNPALRADVLNRFNKRANHYKLLGETAPEFVEINSWIEGENKTLESLRGKVIVLDFWATWCGPCFEAFPHLSAMYNQFREEGLEVLGMTRFYGTAEGEEVTEPAELQYLREFKVKEKLPYPFVVAQSNTTQNTYGATGLPTVVIIDRKGIIRYIETGTTPTRGEEITTIVEKLLAEK